MIWWTRNDHGFWCNFCGNCLKPNFHLECDDAWDEFEEEIKDRNCDECGAPDEFDREAF